MRLLHFADLHLDRTFAFLRQDSRNRPSIRRQDLRRTLTLLLDKALETQAEVLCIAGDLYEHERASADLAMFLRNEFARYPDLRICISPGNHDPYDVASIYRRNDWPSNVHIFHHEDFRSIILSGKVTLWGTAFQAPDRDSAPFQGFTCPGNGIHLALVHGSLQRSGARQFGQGYSPFREEDLRACGFDFVMLGHYHSPYEALSGPHPFAYSGSPARFTFEEESPQRALLIDIDGDIRVTSIPIPGRRYVSRRYDLSGDATSNELIDGIERLAAQDGEWQQACVEIILEGERQPSLGFDLQALPAMLEEALGCFFVRVRDWSSEAYDIVTLAREPTTRGEFVRRMLARLEVCQNEAERARLKKALSYGLGAFAGREVPLA